MQKYFLISLGSLLLLLSGCGQSGPLYLPNTKNQPHSHFQTQAPAQTQTQISDQDSDPMNNYGS